MSTETATQTVKFFDYVWKHNGPLPVDATSVRFRDKALEKEAVFADLRNGRSFKVFAVSKGTEELGTFKHVPKDIVHTFDAKSLSEEELMQLRTRCKFEDGDEWRYVIRMTIAEQFAGEYAVVNRDDDSALDDLIGRINTATTSTAEVPGRDGNEGIIHTFADGSWLDTQTLQFGSSATTFIKRDDGSLAKDDKG
jgi:hypothetical protein